MTLRTTFIVGFPGETEADFAELEGFVADTGFDHLGVFTYSHEEGTRAFAMEDDVPGAVKAETQRDDGASKEDGGARASRAGSGPTSTCCWMGRRPITPWSSRAGWKDRPRTSIRSST